MSNQQHPITPPPELFAKCYEQAERQLQSGFALKFAMSCAIRTAYAAGADAELKACVEWLVAHGWFGSSNSGALCGLRAARRPKPPSLAEEALVACERSAFGIPGDRDTIRAALERLQKLEQQLD